MLDIQSIVLFARALSISRNPAKPPAMSSANTRRMKKVAKLIQALL